VTYAPENQQELAAAREGKPIGAPIGGDSGFLRCPGLALQIRVSDLCPDRCSHRHRSFAVTDQQTRTAETRGHGRGGYLRRYASSGTSAQCLGDRLRILVAMLICHISRVHDGTKVAGYICGIVMIAHGASAWSHAFLRFTETALGIGVAWLISFVPKLIRIDETDATSDRADTLAPEKGRAVRMDLELKGAA
jgi:hypothetical protein